MKTQVFTLFSSSPNDRDLAQVATALKKGAVMIYPTDTVYALGCLSNNAVALEKLARLKNIKLEKAPLSFLFCLLYTSPSPRDRSLCRMPSSA